VQVVGISGIQGGRQAFVVLAGARGHLSDLLDARVRSSAVR
jgi:hypothetical protein